MSDAVKALIDGLDKITDILNIGRLLFYSAAGFCALLPAAMCLMLLSHGDVVQPYWTQFVSDLGRSAHHWGVWFAGLIFGFIISVLANAIFDFRPGDGAVDAQFYAYLYPRLFSGGIKPKEGEHKDFAAWLISEYYRYYEIALFVPYGLMLSLPLYTTYSLIFLVRSSYQSKGFFLGGEYLAFPLWAFGCALIWTRFWPDFWLPRVVQPTYSGWIWAKRNTAEGLEKFVQDAVPREAAKPPDSSKAQA